MAIISAHFNINYFTELFLFSPELVEVPREQEFERETNLIELIVDRTWMTNT